MLKSFSLDITKEGSGKIVEAVLNIESNGVKHKLTLEYPTVPSASSTTVRDLFNDLTLESVDFFEVFGKQDGSEGRWRIEIGKDDTLKEGHTISCSEIQGLPPEKDKKG
jgi:hypothetical protein